MVRLKLWVYGYPQKTPFRPRANVNMGEGLGQQLAAGADYTNIAAAQLREEQAPVGGEGHTRNPVARCRDQLGLDTGDRLFRPRAVPDAVPTLVALSAGRGCPDSKS